MLNCPAIRIPYNFKLFLSNDRNKEQLCYMSKIVWNSPETVPQILKYSKAILVVEGKGYSYKCFNMRIDLKEIISLSQIKKKAIHALSCMRIMHR